MLIDLFSSDLVAGYKEIVIARQALLTKWRFELLRAYTQKWDRYTRQLAGQEARKARYQRLLPFIGVALLSVCSIGAWLTLRSVDLACLGMVLTFGTGVGALLLLLDGISQTPPPPEPIGAYRTRMSLRCGKGCSPSSCPSGGVRWLSASQLNTKCSRWQQRRGNGA
jgi:hypothetical protein